MVRATKVHKSFGRLEVLRGIDLIVNPGEVLCLIGPSGSGKSTFLRCINHLEKIDGGELSVDGELVGYRRSGDRLYELKDREVCGKRAEIGMVFQRFNLFPHMSALDNVMSGPVRVKKESVPTARDRAVRLLERVVKRTTLIPDEFIARGGRVGLSIAVRRVHPKRQRRRREGRRRVV